MKPCKHCGSVGHEGSSSMTNLCEHIQLITALRSKLSALAMAGSRLTPHIPKGTEPHGQDMNTSNRMAACRKFRIALAEALAVLPKGDRP